MQQRKRRNKAKRNNKTKYASLTDVKKSSRLSEDLVMVKEGLRHRPLQKLEQKVKSSEDRKKLKEMKAKAEFSNKSVFRTY